MIRPNADLNVYLCRESVRLLGDYAGRLVTDGDEGYIKVVRRNEIPHAGCWVHSRRPTV